MRLIDTKQYSLLRTTCDGGRAIRDGTLCQPPLPGIQPIQFCGCNYWVTVQLVSVRYKHCIYSPIYRTLVQYDLHHLQVFISFPFR